MASRNIFNIINFVRSEEPRVSFDSLLTCTLQELALCQRHKLPSTFLLQYDVLDKTAFTEPLKAAGPYIEMGVWLEFCRRQIEKVGLPWRGPEDCTWHWEVCPDMLMAYTLEERRLLIDEQMNAFKEVFGTYPRSVGSWLLDSDSLAYMRETYGIVAACICRDQFGTDGYTLWGGYYGQGYYPSKENLICPAQTTDYQLNVPVFRMLGPDPIHQYDSGLDEQYDPAAAQKVFTLEPALGCGQDPAWMDWFFHTTFEAENLGFGYAQVGQENFYSWQQIGASLTTQIDKLVAGIAAGKWEALTLADTGEWFSKTYPLTPPTAISALTDPQNTGKQSVWYDSRRYRVNWYTDGNRVGIRDCFLFDQTWVDRYREAPATGNAAVYENLPVVDGYRWSGNGIRAGLWFTRPDGTQAAGRIEAAESAGHDRLLLTLTVDGETVTVLCAPDRMTVCFSDTRFALALAANTTAGTTISANGQRACYVYRDRPYTLHTDGTAICQNLPLIMPSADTLTLSFA